MPKRKKHEVEPYSREWLEAINKTPKYKQWWLQEQLNQLVEEQKEAKKGGKGDGKDGKKEDGKSSGKGESSKVLHERIQEDGPPVEMDPSGVTEVPYRMADLRREIVSYYPVPDKERFLRDDTYLGNFKLEGEPPKIILPDSLPYYKKKVAASMIDNQFDREIKNQRKGALDTNSLYKAYTGSDRVFKRKEEPKNKKYAIGFLYDKSGSMYNSRGRGVVRSIYTIHDMLYSLSGMRMYEAYFDTDFRLLSHPEWRRSGYEVAAKYAANLSGTTDDFQWRKAREIQDVLERKREKVAQKYEGEVQLYSTDLPPYDGENNDGEALERMIQWMSREPDTVSTKILFVIGDGGIGNSVQGDVRTRIVPMALEKHGIKVIGISIGSTELTRMYPDCLTVKSDASDLPEILAAKIASLVKRG